MFRSFFVFTMYAKLMNFIASKAKLSTFDYMSKIYSLNFWVFVYALIAIIAYTPFKVIPSILLVCCTLSLFKKKEIKKVDVEVEKE